MSTFDGFITEIPHISVDRFCDENLKSKVFFLSHCHTDHMVGLQSAANSLEGFPGPLYASPISVVFLKQFPRLENHLLELNVGETNIIEIPRSKNENECQKLSVTALPAGHCPGSIMLIFETSFDKILYTGDIRLSTSYKKMKGLHTNSVPKTFDNIYLDTTFLDLNYKYFPSQFQSFDEIFKISRDWLRENERNKLLLKLPAKYGSEFVFIELSKRLKIPIHVSHDLYEKYKCISDMDGCVTLDATKTKIHACEYNKLCDDYHKNDRKFQLLLKPTALFWKNLQKHDPIVKYENDHSVRVCYSSHASYDELKDFISYLKPKSVTPCVVPENKERELNLLIDDLMNKIPESNVVNLPKENLSKDILLLKNIMKRSISKIETEDKNTKACSKKIVFDSDLWDASDL